MRIRKRFLLVILLILCFLLAGCSLLVKNDQDHMPIIKEAIFNRDYELASKHLKKELKTNPRNKEAKILTTYIDFEEHMLMSAFWKYDEEALAFIAGIVDDVDIEDPRFKCPALVLAAGWERKEMVDILLEAGADPNAGADVDGLTALMWACKTFNEQYDMVLALLEAGADINAKSNYDETPLAIAIEYGNENVANLLIEYGARE